MLLIRNITIAKRRTSVRLEPAMWQGLRQIARREKYTVHDIYTLIQLGEESTTSLTAAIWVFLMLYYRAAATEDGHSRAGHGDFTKMVQRSGTNSGSSGESPIPLVPVRDVLAETRSRLSDLPQHAESAVEALA